MPLDKPTDQLRRTLNQPDMLVLRPKRDPGRLSGSAIVGPVRLPTHNLQTLLHAARYPCAMPVQAVEEIALIAAVCMIVVGLWPGPWRVSLSLKAGDEERIKGIKEAIDILEHELALLEPVEPEPRTDRLLRRLRALVQPSR